MNGRLSISSTLWQPQAESTNTTDARSAEMISRRANSLNDSYSASGKILRHRPGAVRPARPVRWSALALDTALVVRRRRPVSSSIVATRRSPESTTAVTPSSVSDASAIGDATTTRRPRRP